MLRPLELEDLDLLYDVENDRDQWSVASTNVPYSRHYLRRYILDTTADIYTDKQLRLVVETDEGQAVGFADLINFSPENRRAEVGIIIFAPYRRQGHCQRALLELAVYARTVLHLHQLYALVGTANDASRQAFLSAGYAEGARLADWICRGDSYEEAIVMQLKL